MLFLTVSRSPGQSSSVHPSVHVCEDLIEALQGNGNAPLWQRWLTDILLVNIYHFWSSGGRNSSDSSYPRGLWGWCLFAKGAFMTSGDFWRSLRLQIPSGEQGLAELLEMLTRELNRHILFPISCFSTWVALSEDKVPLVSSLQIVWKISSFKLSAFEETQLHGRSTNIYTWLFCLLVSCSLLCVII